MVKEEEYKGKTIRVATTICPDGSFGWSAFIDGAQVFRTTDHGYQPSSTEDGAIEQGMRSIKDRIDNGA